jgi:putative AdoMet-dependent methyltransferase
MDQAPKRHQLFEGWAKTYDQDVSDWDTFPFMGYGDVLEKMIEVASLRESHKVLDLGIGTGNLAKRLPLPETHIWGVDFSRAMLAKARAVLPRAWLIQGDLTGSDWSKKLGQPFDRILSAYTFHEFSDSVKIRILEGIKESCLKPSGLIVIGDISFEDQKHFDRAHHFFKHWWDEDEYYWCAKPLTESLESIGFSVQYIQMSVCAGVYLLNNDDG